MRWWQFKRRDADLERELRADLELEEEEQRERGLSAEDASLAARRALGNAALIRERTHEAWGWAPFEHLWQDLRCGVRQFMRNPGFAAVAVLTLALGIGVNTTIFSAVSAVLLRKPPVQDPDTLCAVSSRDILESYDLARASAPDFQSWQEQNDVFRQMSAAETGRSFTLTGKFLPESVQGDRVTPGFFSVIGVMPVLGRPFLPSENQPGRNREVILSASLWREHFQSAPDAIGRNLNIDGEPYRIVGVMPPFAGVVPSAAPQLWTPLVFTPDDLSPSARGNHFIDLVLGRVKPGITVQQAQAEMDSIASQLAQRYPATNRNWGITVLTLQEHNIRFEDTRNAVLLLMTAVGLVLLIACANVAGLLLTRGACRSHEFAVRSALGASRGRLMRQMLTESLLIGTSSGLAGVLIALAGIRLLRAGFDFNELGKRMGAGFRIDVPTLLFMLAATFLTTILFSLLPALRSSNAPPRGALSQTGRTVSAGKGSSRLRRLLVAAEVAMAVILLTAAGVLMREVLREINEPNGFNPHHLLIANLDVSGARYKKPDTRIALYRQVVEKIQKLPEVESADLDSCVPMGCDYGLSFQIVGRPPQSPSERPTSDFDVVGPDYFRTLQIPLLQGRGFSDSDDAHAPVVAVVNREFVQRFFPHEKVIGRQIEAGDGTQKRARIVGIVSSVNNYPGQLHPHPRIYESYFQIPVNAFSAMGLVVRSRVPAAQLTPMLRHAVWSVDKAQPVGVRTMEDLVNDNVGGDKLMVGLMGLFAGLAVGLSALGIYGVIAYSVAQRTREIGIRVALGAKRQDLLRLILREGGILIGIGCTLGALAALLLPRIIRGLLNGVAPQGPLAVFAAAVMVCLIAFLATCIPAYRAMKIDFVGALRAE